MRIMSIASGSSGNCTYIGTDKTHILIDAGVSRKRICEGLKKADISIDDISAVFLTHEHIDHIQSAGVIMRKDGLSFYGTDGTINALSNISSLGDIPDGQLHGINKNIFFTLGDLKIYPFSVSHDAADPVAYTISDDKHKIGIVTDLGEYTQNTIEKMQNCDVVLAEANHDIRMLQSGPYPYQLKQRIMGKQGHLSNESSGKLISSILNDKIKHILLGHLSKENNYDKLAFETVKSEINNSKNPYTADDFKISIASHCEPSDIIEM